MLSIAPLRRCDVILGGFLRISLLETPNPQFWGLRNHAPPELGPLGLWVSFLLEIALKNRILALAIEKKPLDRYNNKLDLKISKLGE